MSMQTAQIPTLDQIEEAFYQIKDTLRYTPIQSWQGVLKERLLGSQTQAYFKLELLQHAGSFKSRGALINILGLDQAALARGVTAVSAGNHAIAVSYAAKKAGSSAKVVMPDTANPMRVQLCRDLGAAVELVRDVQKAFARVEEIQETEGRTFIHPFEGEKTILGTATVGYEFCQQVPDLEAVIIPVGGGGLAAGIAAAFHRMNPDCVIYGVEPVGADSMSRSFESGQPEKLDKVRTIADSLGAPFALPMSFGICKALIKKIVLVNDPALVQGMQWMFEDLKLAAEPACASALAALAGPLAETLRGKKVGLIACGSNIDVGSFFNYLALK